MASSTNPAIATPAITAGSKSQHLQELASTPPINSTANSPPLRSDSNFDTSDTASSRWLGRATKWRRLTRDDRQAATSLDQIENDDLSIHLYNAHAIKRNTYSELSFQGEAGNDFGAQSKDRWKDCKRWRPKDNWTAWPLTTQEVPKCWETWSSKNGLGHFDGDSTISHDAPRPSKEVSELLCAEMMSHAREKSHESPDVDVLLSRNTQDAGVEETMIETDLAESTQTYESDSAGFSDNDEAEASEEQQENTDDDESIDLGRPPGSNSSGKSSLNTSHQSSFNYGLEPSISSDDEESILIFQPLARHVLRSFDDLLMGLHHSRQNHVPRGSDRSDSESSKGPRSKSKSSRHKSARPRRPYKLGLRDWSEVLGTAAIIGWNSAVVERTVKRCSDLFGEQMSFGTIEEERQNDILYMDQLDRHQYNEIESEKALTEPHAPGALKSAGWICPEKMCARHIKPFNRRRNWLQHVESKHGYRYEGPELLARPSESVQWELADCIRSCPDPQCRRHQKPYRERWRLREHIKRNHGVRLAGSSRSRSRGREVQDSSSESSAWEPDSNEMVGGVHVDGFLKPVSAKVGLLTGKVRRPNGRDAAETSRRVPNGKGKNKRRREVAESPMHTSDG